MIQIAMLLQWRPWHMPPGDHMGSGGWMMMLLFWLIVIGLIAWLVVTLLRREGGDTPPREQEEDRAESVLRERYARDPDALARRAGDLGRGLEAFLRESPGDARRGGSRTEPSVRFMPRCWKRARLAAAGPWNASPAG